MQIAFLNLHWAYNVFLMPALAAALLCMEKQIDILGSCISMLTCSRATVLIFEIFENDSAIWEERLLPEKTIVSDSLT